MSLRDLLSGLEPTPARDRRRQQRLFEKFGVLDNPFPSANQSRSLPRLEGQSDRQIADRVRVFRRDPHPSQVILIQGTQGVGKTNLLDWYEKQFADILSDSEGYALIRYYPDPDPTFDLILHRIFEDLQQHRLLQDLGTVLAERSDDEAGVLIESAEHADFRLLLQSLRAAGDNDPTTDLNNKANLAVEWMIGMRLLTRHRQALGVRMRLDTLEGKTRVLRDLVQVTGRLNLLHGIFLLLDELEKLDQTVSKIAVVRFLMAIRALIDALPHNLFLMLAMTPAARSRYFSFVPALAGRLQFRVQLEPLQDFEDAKKLYELYLNDSREKARAEGEREGWTAGTEQILSSEELQHIYERLQAEADRLALAGVTQRQFLHHVHRKAEEKLLAR